LGPDVPLHFSAFHPDFKLTDRGGTPPGTLLTAYNLAQNAGLHYIYLGNILSGEHQNTYCPKCGRVVIGRDGYDLRSYAIKSNQCPFCQSLLAGRFDDAPGTWGARRQPIDITRYAK
jgi:hypothetical protein